MKGSSEVIEALNKALSIELTSINQYFVQARVCRRLGYNKLGEKHYSESIEEMRHAEKIIDRIVFLEGAPVVHTDTIYIGADVKEQFDRDLKLEMRGVQTYNDGIEVSLKVKDAGTREELEHILALSEAHVQWLEAQLNLIQMVGLDNYLADQIGEEKS